MTEAGQIVAGGADARRGARPRPLAVAAIASSREHRRGARAIGLASSLALGLGCALAAQPGARADDPPRAGGEPKPSGPEGTPATPMPPADAAAPTAPAPPAPASGLDRGDGVVRFPSLRVHVRDGYLEVDGRVCLQQGLIEVFACTEYGKVHEAVLVLDCRPEHFHAGLLLLGMRETRGQVKALGQGGALEGERAVVRVRWSTADGVEVEHRAEDLLLDAHDGTTMEPCGFAFTGSRFIDVGGREVFAANASGQLITTFHDPDAILDNPLPKGGDDTVYYANRDLLPARGTEVVVRVRPLAADSAPPAPPGPPAPAPPPVPAPPASPGPGDGEPSRDR